MNLRTAYETLIRSTLENEGVSPEKMFKIIKQMNENFYFLNEVESSVREVVLSYLEEEEIA